MEGPIAEAEALIPMESVSNSDTNATGSLRRKAARRTEPWYLAPPPPSPFQPPQNQDIPARKKPRLETTLATAMALSLSPPPPADVDVDANADTVTETQSNPMATRATARWTPEEDAKLTSGVANTHNTKSGKRDWVAIAVLVPGRTRKQCFRRWKDVLDPSMDLANGRTGKWSENEDIKLKDAVQLRGDKDWVAIAALVPGRTKMQCYGRWHCALDPNIDRANGRTGTWTKDEDTKLKDSVQMHSGKDGQDWAAITLLIPGRTKCQCRSRWHGALDPSIDRSPGRVGTWTEDEDIKLLDAVHMRGGKNWGAIATLVPGRTSSQCHDRWRKVLNPSIERTTGLIGKWTEDEDIKLKDAVQTRGDKDWVAIAMLVPGRTNRQCRRKWQDTLDLRIDRAPGRAGRWTEDEDIKLLDAVQLHGKDWAAITALVPGRTKKQCSRRWHSALDPNIERVLRRTGK
jgi:hypothetical protein